MPRYRIVYTPLDDVPVAEVNAKGHDDALIDASIDRFGYMEPVLLDGRTGRLIAGHGRRSRLIARRDSGADPPRGIVVDRGVWKIPVAVGWSSTDDAEAEAAAIAINQATIAGGWDAATLTRQLQMLIDRPAGLDGLGFTRANLDDLLHREKVEEKRRARADPDEVPPTPARPVTKTGDLWVMGDHRVLCGDSTSIEDVRRVLDGEPIDFAVTSPPYNVGVDYEDNDDEVPWANYERFLRAVIGNVVAELAPGRFLAWNIGAAPKTRPFAHGTLLEEMGLTFVRQLIWWKNSVPMPTYYMTRAAAVTRAFYPNPTHEFVWLFSKGPAERGGAADMNEELLRDDVFRIQATDSTKDLWTDDQQRIVGAGTKTGLAHRRGNVHPAPFPVALPEGFIGYLADRDAIVFDPFAGSGTTIIAAHRTGRRGRGVELGAGYCDVIAERWQRVTDEVPILVRSGKRDRPVDFLARRAARNPVPA